jgi:hypothetical protein
MGVVEASVTRASGAVAWRYAKRAARARFALQSSEAVMSPAVHVKGWKPLTLVLERTS